MKKLKSVKLLHSYVIQIGFYIKDTIPTPGLTKKT